MIALQKLAPQSVNPAQVPDVNVTGVALDSRRVCADGLFLALRGDSADGHDYVDAAVANGAIAVFAQRPVEASTVPVLVVDDLPRHASQIAGEFYSHPTRSMTCVGVTGTNGKTSVAHYTAQLAHKLGVVAGFLGTTGWGRIESDSALQPATLTTADAVSLQERLFELKQDGVQLVAMELSSHALQQHRADALQIDVALFTNLTRDHLDYHGSMADYAAAKARLFDFASLRGSVTNISDEFGGKLAAHLNERAANSDFRNLRLVAASTLDADADADKYADADQVAIRIENLVATAAGLSWTLCTPWGEVLLESPVVGYFNAVNLSLAVAGLALVQDDYSFALSDIAAAVPAVSAPPGRLQRVTLPAVEAPAQNTSPAVFVDYAHTPDALVTALSAVRAHCNGRLICVFGCGGDRDSGKRTPMGLAVVEHADIGFLTSDNPRFEDPLRIIADVESGLPAGHNLTSIADRRAAIEAALQCAGPDDVVVIAGKGHEDYQDIAGVKHAFDDVEVAATILQQRHSAAGTASADEEGAH